jgi:L-ascorbate metabolism protein UlaG (beta-lactamase superfamily)
MSGLLRGLRPLAFGAEPAGERLARIERSPHYDKEAGQFRNPVAASVRPRPTHGRSALMRALLRSEGRKPAGAVPLARPDLGSPPASGLRLTWLGHSTVLAEVDGRRVLFDPVWGMRCSPFSFAGPRRLHPAPVPLEALGKLDAVVVSHDHYDHLDMPTIRELAASDVHFAVPLGVGAHLERWGVEPARFSELDWHETAEVAGLRLTATPARHFCGRGLRNKQRTLWASWVVAGPEHRVFHSGDTGYFPGFAEIGAQHGPFDATMIQIGAYSEFWPDIHMTPEEGLRAHLDLTGTSGALLPIHWGTFNLAPHPWAEPGERTLTAAKEAGVRAAVPVPGGSFEPTAEDLPGRPWWREPGTRPPEAGAPPEAAPGPLKLDRA